MRVFGPFSFVSWRVSSRVSGTFTGLFSDTLPLLVNFYWLVRSFIPLYPLSVSVWYRPCLVCLKLRILIVCLIFRWMLFKLFLFVYNFIDVPYP